VQVVHERFWLRPTRRDGGKSLPHVQQNAERRTHPQAVARFSTVDGKRCTTTAISGAGTPLRQSHSASRQSAMRSVMV
jgi:hypothetical protein